MIGLVVKKKKGKFISKFLADSVFWKKKKGSCFLKGKEFGCFCFLKEKKGNLFLRFWPILFSERKKKRILFSERKKKDFFCFKNSVVSVSGKKKGKNPLVR